MARAADAAGVRHMTAFTYRFVPAMRFMHRLVRDGFVGAPWHFRAQRFQDWGRRYLGWRQRAGRRRHRRDRRHAVAPDRLRAPAGGAHRPRDGLDPPAAGHARGRGRRRAPVRPRGLGGVHRRVPGRHDRRVREHEGGNRLRRGRTQPRSRRTERAGGIADLRAGAAAASSLAPGAEAPLRRCPCRATC